MYISLDYGHLSIKDNTPYIMLQLLLLTAYNFIHNKIESV
jgi:hypothetical protein